MKLQTKIQLKKQVKSQIDYNSNVLLIGSCFSDNIGQKLDYFKFKNFQNPFGILFHPAAIEGLIANAVSEKVYSDADVFFHNEQWHCFEAHSELSNASKEGLLNHLNKQVESTNRQIQKSTHIIITLGTSWAYRFTESNQLVANCHKLDQKQFNKELLSVDTICEALKHIVELIRSLNSKTSVIFTVSPVRHLKDGFIENTRSKAHLFSGIHQFLNEKPPTDNPKSFYFPSYEIMMDELRDYRFFSEDMIHPNPLAINYIWEKFKIVWISDYAYKIIEEVLVVQKGLQHKAFNQKSEAHQKFLQNLDLKIKKLHTQFPHITF